MTKHSTAPYSMAPVARPQPQYWTCQWLGWGVHHAVTTYGMLQMSTPEPERLVLIRLWAMLCAIAISHGWRHVLLSQGWLDQRNWTVWLRGALVLIGMALLYTGLVYLAHDALRPYEQLRGLKDLFWIVLNSVVVFFCWTLVYGIVQARRRALQLEREKMALLLSMKDSELRALQAQINPHFFFNSLNTIRALIYQDQDTAARAVDELAGVMRYSLQAGQAATIPLEQELNAVRAYLGIEQLRFDERLRVDLDLDPALGAYRVAPMSLQTLVENAVKYGVEPSMDGCAIRITGLRSDGMLELSVANEGQLASQPHSTRVGIDNTARRLALLFGASAACTVEQQDGWVVARLRMPEQLA